MATLPDMEMVCGMASGIHTARLKGTTQEPWPVVTVMTPELNRITISRNGPDRVQQLWAKSSDGGKTWATVFQGEYTRKKP